MVELPRSADVVIVGAGFAGLSTAWALAERGVSDVLVVEREADLGRFASGRSAGLGRQLAEDDAWTALTVRGAALLRASFPHAWTATGGVLTFDNAEHAQSYVERAARFGIDVEPMTAEMVLGYWPELETLELSSALHVPSDGVIAVRALLDAYAARAQLSLSTAVTAIEPMNGGARVKTSRGDVVARFVVDACGAWAGIVPGDAPMPSWKRHVYMLDAAPSPGAPYVWHLGARELYVRGAGDETLASPCDATEVPSGDQQADADGEAKLRRAVAGSSLERASITRAWACQRTFAPEGTMRLGRDATRPWLVWAAGLGGHGATASAAVGEAVASAVRAMV